LSLVAGKVTPMTGKSDIVLRRAVNTDSGAVADLLMAAKDDIPLYVRPDTPPEQVVAHFGAYLLKGNGWVVTLGGVLAAALILEPDDKEMLYLVTDERHRRIGAARGLIDQAKQIAVSEGWNILMAKTNPPNELIGKVLGNEGFSRAGEIATKTRTWHRWIWKPS